MTSLSLKIEQNIFMFTYNGGTVVSQFPIPVRSYAAFRNARISLFFDTIVRIRIVLWSRRPINNLILHPEYIINTSYQSYLSAPTFLPGTYRTPVRIYTLVYHRGIGASWGPPPPDRTQPPWFSPVRRSKPPPREERRKPALSERSACERYTYCCCSVR